MALLPILGRVAHRFGDDYDVDQIVGVGNIKLQDIDRLVACVLERLGDDFARRVQPGDVLVAGRNFGYGHPHFPAMRAMRKLGIRAVVAESFFPVYWRGEISNGFVQVAAPGIALLAEPGDPIEIDFDACAVHLPARDTTLALSPYGAAERAILEAGGFRAWLAMSLATDRQGPDR
jgi:3-isopropylmalate/(R)-2-methylmalate dehydratase small subunit